MISFLVPLMLSFIRSTTAYEIDAQNLEIYERLKDNLSVMLIRAIVNEGDQYSDIGISST